MDLDSYSNFDEVLYANKALAIQETKIPGLLKIELVLHGDARGWFKESFQREKLVHLGFPEDFIPVQNNVSSNRERGVTRGFHAEPWNKHISLTRGKAFVALVDLRAGETFGVVETFTITPAEALFLPKGIGNSYQTLTPDVEYSYLVDAHWSADATYTFVNLADEQLAVKWPIPLNRATISEKDLAHPRLKDIQPMEV